MSEIELIDPPPLTPYNEAMLLVACRQRQTSAGHGERFVGRPVTRLIDTGEHIIKLRTEYRLPVVQARRFVAQAITIERKLGVYHPHKTWFLWISEADDEQDEQVVLIGNVTPRLQALNHSEDLLQSHSPAAYIELIARMLDCYLVVSARHELSLDLCLSNFAVDEDDTLYYLDDDCYPGTSTTVLSDALGVLIRSQQWLDEALAKKLGRRLRRSLHAHIDDSHWITVIAEGVRGVFVPVARQRVVKALVEALYSGQTFSYHSCPTSQVIALLADVHGNAPALECALDYLSGRTIDTALVLGDIVGYGPQPRECIDMLRGMSDWMIIRGNHDHAVATGHTRKGVSSLAHWTLNWSMEHLDQDARAWLASLPPYLQTENWLAVHGSPKDKTFFNGYVYQMSYGENLDELESRGIPLCFHGHTHIQKVYRRDHRGDTQCVIGQQELQDAGYALICPGSVGQPRGGEAGVELAIMDLETCQLEFHRLAYDLEKTLKVMTEKGFPPALGERLRQGQ
jgi:predicted phosphodiesterase